MGQMKTAPRQPPAGSEPGRAAGGAISAVSSRGRCKRAATPTQLAWAYLPLLAQGAVVLLDCHPETWWHFVGSRQRERLVLAAIHLLPKAELPVLQLLERCRLQRRKAPRIGECLIVVEPLEIADDLIELARVLARLREL